MVKRLNIHTISTDERDGYGRHTRKFSDALLRNGVDVSLYPIALTYYPKLQADRFDIDHRVLNLSICDGGSLQQIEGKHWVFTMNESTRLYADWVDTINRFASRVLTPCQWCADHFRASGIQMPVHVIPEGIDPSEFPLLPRRPAGRPYTFMALGDRGLRKGFDIAIQAFQLAFPDQDDVRLIIKTRKTGLMVNGTRPLFDMIGTDYRVSIWREDLPSMALAYPLADCFVFPSKGEGWGLPPREAAAMGLPVIVSRSSGLLEGIEQYAWRILDVEKTPAPAPYEGLQDTVAVETLIDAMRSTYDNQDAAHEFGQRAGQWLRDHQTWDHAAQAFIELMVREGLWQP